MGQVGDAGGEYQFRIRGCCERMLSHDPHAVRQASSDSSGVCLKIAKVVPVFFFGGVSLYNRLARGACLDDLGREAKTKHVSK